MLKTKNVICSPLPKTPVNHLIIEITEKPKNKDNKIKKDVNKREVLCATLSSLVIFALPASTAYFV